MATPVLATDSIPGVRQVKHLPTSLRTCWACVYAAFARAFLPPVTRGQTWSVTCRWLAQLCGRRAHVAGPPSTALRLIITRYDNGIFPRRKVEPLYNPVKERGGRSPSTAAASCCRGGVGLPVPRPRGSPCLTGRGNQKERGLYSGKTDSAKSRSVCVPGRWGGHCEEGWHTGQAGILVFWK